MPAAATATPDTDDTPATEPVVEEPPGDVEPPEAPATDDGDPDAPPVVSQPDLVLAPTEGDATPDAPSGTVDTLTGLTVAQLRALAILREATAEFEKGYKPTVWCRACTDAKKGNQGLTCNNQQHVVVADCPKCHNRITSAHVDLTYMGHAAVTNRLLRADPTWQWEPQERDVNEHALSAAIATGNADTVKAIIANSPPKMRDGGMWITLTVAGLSRPGFGDAGGKSPGPNAVKEIIGDAVRNAAMRFGCGLDLWHKGEFEDDVTATHLPEAERPSAADQRARRDAETAHNAAEGSQAAPASNDTPAAGNAAQSASQPASMGSAADPQIILDTLAGIRGRKAWQALRDAAEAAPAGLTIEVEWKGASMTMEAAFAARAQELAAQGVS